MKEITLKDLMNLIEKADGEFCYVVLMEEVTEDESGDATEEGKE